MTDGQPLGGSKAGGSHSTLSITKQDLAQIKSMADSGRASDLSSKEDSSVLQKLQKWADYVSYGEPVQPTRFLPMKTPMSSEIIQNWSLDEPPRHVLTVQSLLKEQQEKSRTIGLIIDLSNHETLYAEDLQAVHGLQYSHIPLVAKAFPPAPAIIQVIKTAKAYWKEHPKNYIGIHCAYGFNRTGFVVCAYLIQVCRLNVQEALAAFGTARPPGVKHEKFVVELARRYGTRLPMVPATPDGEPVDSAAPASMAREPSSSTASDKAAGSSPSGDSPPALQIRGSGGGSGGRLIRLYPDGADPLQPWEPGTPSMESRLATQQVWESLQRGQHTAYRFRAASELSVAGSDAGGRFSDDEAGRSSMGDGHFSCSSVYSEFGLVAQHLEENYPGLAIARTSMRPLPPRSTTSEASTVASEMGRKPSSGLPATIGASAPDGIPTRSPSPQPVLLSEQVSGLEQPPSLLPPQELQQPLPVQRPVRAESPVDIDRGAGGKDSLRAGSWERRPPGLLSASFAAEHMYPDNDEAAINGVHDSAASPRAANSVPRSPTGNGRIPICESGSLQKSFVSNSSLHSESAHSLVNNESLGLDERNIFENFSKMAASRRRKSPRMVEDADGEPQSRLTLQDSQPGSDGEENFVMEMGPIDGCPSGAAGLASGECTPLSPFASPAFQASPAVGAEVGADSRVPDHSDGLGEGATAAVGRRERGAGIGRDIPKHKPARARQKGATRCSLM